MTTSLDPKELLFSVNQYDRDGDITERGVFLNLGCTSVKAADNLYEFRIFIRELGTHLESMADEIDENYPGA